MIEPYYEDASVMVYLGDCRELLPALDLTVDVTITDPPYGETSLEWDSWPKGWPGLIPGPALWCFGSMRMFLEQRTEFEAWRFGQDVIWEKQDGSAFATDRFRRVHEHVLHWYQGAWGDLRREVPQVPGGVPKNVRRAPVGKFLHGERAASSYVSDGTRYARSVLAVNNCHGYALHPTQKPVGIIRPLVDYSCPPGGIVLDPFMGSGSSLLAARDCGRRAVGIEAREDYCEMAVRRLGQGVLAVGGDAHGED